MPQKYNISKHFKEQIFVLPLPQNGSKTEPKDISDSNTPADFEAAISATGFGKYNVFLILIAIPAGFACSFATTTMSYVFPAAQCDLDLSLEDKGLLNAITYFGMISSGLIWGFLTDTLGRKRLLSIGYILDSIIVVASSFSQSKALLMTTKYLNGFIINGPFAALTAYISEHHAAQYRARMQLVLGVIFNSANVILPLLAWAILPRNLDFPLLGSTIHSWNIYLFISGIPSILSALIFLFMPESPKFLMTTGQNEKALEVFQRVFCLNTGLSKEDYPIKCLVDEIQLNEQNPNAHGGHVTAHRSKITALKEGWQQMKPLCFPPYLKKVILVCSIQCTIMMSVNTLRLWLPQIFQAMNDYYQYHQYDNEESNLCTMLELLKPANSTSECTVNTNNSSVYINSMTVASVTVSSYLIAGYLINILGKKRLLCLMSTISGVCAIGIYFTKNTTETLISSSIYTASASISSNVVIAIIIDLFPTTSRTMTVALAMILGRFGALTGNVIFPILLQTGCLPPFLTMGFVILGCAAGSLLLPNTDMKALE